MLRIRIINTSVNYDCLIEVNNVEELRMKSLMFKDLLENVTDINNLIIPLRFRYHKIAKDYFNNEYSKLISEYSLDRYNRLLNRTKFYLSSIYLIQYIEFCQFIGDETTEKIIIDTLIEQIEYVHESVIDYLSPEVKYSIEKYLPKIDGIKYLRSLSNVKYEFLIAPLLNLLNDYCYTDIRSEYDFRFYRNKEIVYVNEKYDERWGVFPDSFYSFSIEERTLNEALNIAKSGDVIHILDTSKSNRNPVLNIDTVKDNLDKIWVLDTCTILTKYKCKDLHEYIYLNKTYGSLNGESCIIRAVK